MAKKRSNVQHKEPLAISAPPPSGTPLEQFGRFIDDCTRLFGPVKLKMTRFDADDHVLAKLEVLR